MLIKKIFSLIVGILLMILGLIGLLLPILPGWAFLFAGIGIVDPKRAKGMIRWLKNKISEKLH